jgi:ribosomal protein S28E/S33
LARAVFAMAAMAFGGACTPTGPAKMSETEISKEASFQRQLALEHQIDNQRRIEGVSFRLMKAAAQFCGARRKAGYGFTVANRYSFGEEMVVAAQELFGLDDSARVLTVTPGSPAFEAGLTEGDIVFRIDNSPINRGKDSAAEVARILERSGASGVVLQVRGENPGRVVLSPTEVCGYPVQTLNSDKVNAYSDGQNIKITKGMLWFVDDDAELAMVLAHELAHNVMGHAGTFRGMFEDKKSREADADRVGLYLMARAGFEIDSAPKFWRRVAAAFPRMIGSSASHPIMPYRIVALKETTREIRAMESSGLPLIPRHAENLPGAGTPEYPDIATKFANLVLLHHARARYDEAVPAYQRSLTILEDDPPDPNIPDWPRILENSPL